MLRDLHDNIQCSEAMAPVTANTGTTAVVSTILDTADFGSNEFVAVFGAVGNGTFTVLLEDGNNSALSDNATVDPSYVLGVVAGLVPIINKTLKLGYIGPKRYLRVTITPVGNSSAIYLGAIWIQSNGRKPPYSTQIN